MVGPEVVVGRIVADKYQILELLGRGGMANVWLARDERLGKLWAIKEIKPNTQGTRGEVFRQALVDEAHLMKRLDHPAIPRVVDIMDTGATTFVVMDYVEGAPLSAIMRRRGAPFGQDRVIAWGIQLCDVLGYLHALGPGIVYRDMKPSNVIVRDDGSVRLVDFGIALDLGGEGIGGETPVGTPGYAAPEQLPSAGVRRGFAARHAVLVDGRADVYALGATLYSLVSGHMPKLLRDGAGTERVSFAMRPIRAWDPSLSEGLERILLRATEPDPNDRYQTVGEMRYDLEHHMELTDQWRSAQRRRIAAVWHRAFASVACATLGIALLAGSAAISRSTYEGVMREAVAASRSASDDGPSEAERLARQAVALSPSSLEPYRLLLDIYESDYRLSDAEARRMQRAFGRSESLNKAPGYAQLCFDVGVCYLSYFGVEHAGGSVGNAAIESSRAALPWFEQALDACDAKEPGAVLPLSVVDERAAAAYCSVAGFFDEVSRAGREGRAAEGAYRSFWEALAHSIDRENSAPSAEKSTEGMRARLCQIGMEVICSPTYLAGLSRAGVGEDEVTQMLERIGTCLEGLGSFASLEEFQEVFGPVFAEIEEERLLVEQTMRSVYGNPVVLRGAEGNEEGI